MDEAMVILLVLVLVIFVVGVVVGLALSHHCRVCFQSSTVPSSPLQSVTVVPQALVKKPLRIAQAASAPGPLNISARAVNTDGPAPELSFVGGPKRMASVEVGEIYRTASALSIYLDEMETRPNIKRLMSMPSLNDPQRIIDANQFNPAVEVHMDEIDLQEQVGKGGYGAVYKGTWRGAVVAVKYAVCDVEDAQSLEQSIREVVLSKKMGHPNVVQTYAWTVLTGQEAAGVAALEDEADVVKAALAKTNTASIANMVDMAAKPPARASRGEEAEQGGLDPAAEATQPLRVGLASADRGARCHRAQEGGEVAFPVPQESLKHILEPPLVESPFANYVPASEFSESSSRTRSGPTENISPLFERMLLESAHQAEEAEGPETVKRKLGFEEQPPAPAALARGAYGGCQDEFVAREGSTQEAATSSLGKLMHGSEENAAAAANAALHEFLHVALPEGLPPLHQVESTAFSDISGCMLSPAEDNLCTPAGARSGSGICPAPPRSYLLRTSSLGSRSGMQSPLRGSKPKTPDSFNRHAPPGTSLFDGTEATPQRLHRDPEGGHQLPPRARRRISFDPSVDNRGLRSNSILGDRRSCAQRWHSRSGPVPCDVLFAQSRARSLSPAGDRPNAGLQDAQVEEAKTPKEPSRAPKLARDSPADTDALLAGHTASTQASDVFEFSGRGELTSAAEALCDLELQSSGQSLSAQSCTSFNSNEGFGSPMAQRNRRRNSLSLEDGPCQGPSSFRDHEAMMVVVMEFCDLQSLHRAITKKVFKPHGKFSKQATYRALLRTAQEIAKGMDYIHGFGIIHGDLKPGNVLLKTHRIDRRGYIAKVSDFGLSKPASASDEGATGMGTIAYTAPETFQEESINKASDVYAFGILLWEMHHCREAYEGLLEGQICHGVCDGTLRPESDSECPKQLWDLMCCCWAQRPGERPSFKEIVKRLTEIEAAYRKECHLQNPNVGRSRRASAANSPAGGLGRRRIYSSAGSARGSVRA